jgi:tRNA-dependent cyclodipeptide synthase
MPEFMRIDNYLNTTKQDIENRNFNIWVGISLGNKWFTQENIKEYILWSLDHSKDGIMVIIGDTLHAINLEVLSTMKKETALAKAIKLGGEKLFEVQKLIRELPESEQKRIEIARWDEVTDSDEYRNNFQVFKNEYATNDQFRNRILQIVKEGRPDRQSTISKLNQAKLDRLAEYVLNELPILVNGITSRITGHIYTAIIYPGISDLDYLKIGLNNKTEFPELANKLTIQNKIAVLDGYPS